MLPDEKIFFDDLESCYSHQEYSLPLAWAGSIVTLARQEGRIPNDKLLKSLQEELDNFRTQCSMLSGYDWVINPLGYTQVFIFISKGRDQFSDVFSNIFYLLLFFIGLFTRW